MSSSSWTSHTEASSAEPAQVVTSPEQVVLHFPIAGPTARMLAYALDLLAIVVLELGLGLALLIATPIAGPLGEFISSWIPDDPKTATQQAFSGFFLVLILMFTLGQLLIEWGYFSFFELTMGGRSPGKWLIGLRVMRDGGMPITLRESLLRNLLRIVDMLPSQYLVGLVTMVMSPECKRLGDLLAGTVVVRTASAPAPRPLPPRDVTAQAAFRFERAQLALIGTAEGALLRQALRRSEEFPAEQGAIILARAAEALGSKLGYRPLAPDEHRDFLLALLHQTRER